ncbi:hypothetical protein BGM09_08940 [Streptomyces sp. CBMA29]|nr:tetratricopeptide repeat protein [Streptomyces sp. CBMA29]MBD0739572.1 hypothetical protein [Streptomyces sp. CBMA29]
MSGTVHGPSVQAAQIGHITFQVAAPPAPGPDVRPDQVPPLTVRFINRTADLARLHRSFGAGTDGSGIVRLGALSGLPGVGKTATVTRWAHDARDQFPDGQLYVDFAPLRDRVGGDVSEALGICLRGLGVGAEHVPASVENRAELFRTKTTGRRLLVVLDGVSEPGQVAPLLPGGAGSVVLVTSHKQLDDLVFRHHAEQVPLGPLDTEGGLRILADRCEEKADADPTAARALVDLCGGLPVAVHIVAARLITNRRLTVADLAGELADETRRLTGMSLRGEHSVSAVLSLAYADLPPDAARLYRLLGWLPGRTFDTATAAAVGVTDLEAAHSTVSALEAASLVEELSDGRFRLHDLVRLHARERAVAEEAPDEQRAVVERVITHYLVLTSFADRAVREDRLRVADVSVLLREFSDPFGAAAGPRPLEWLAAERTNILAVLREAARGGLRTPVWQLAEAFTVYFLHSRHLADWKEALGLGAAAASAAVEPAAEARLRSLRSRPLMDLDEFDLARAELDKAVACAEVGGRPDVLASVQEFDGRYWDRFDPARAVQAYQRAADLSTAAGLPRGTAIALLFLGRAQGARGDHASALRTLRRAHDDLTRLDDPRMAARALAAIGAAHDRLGDPHTALNVLEEAARQLREQRATHYEAEARITIADITERTGGSSETVRNHLTEAIAVYDAEGNPAGDALRSRLERLRDPDTGAGSR